MVNNVQKLHKITCSLKKSAKMTNARQHNRMLSTHQFADPACVCFLVPTPGPSRFPAWHIHDHDLLRSNPVHVILPYLSVIDRDQ